MVVEPVDIPNWCYFRRPVYVHTFKRGYFSSCFEAQNRGISHGPSYAAELVSLEALPDTFSQLHTEYGTMNQALAV